VPRQRRLRQRRPPLGLMGTGTEGASMLLAPTDWTDSRASPSMWTKYPALPDVARRPCGPSRGALAALLALLPRLA
jgi:hypothetical protein